MRARYSKQAEKFLDKQNDSTYERITSAVKKLPVGDVCKMRGSKNKFRLRIGGFRIIFKVNGDVVSVEDIDNRGQVYK